MFFTVLLCSFVITNNADQRSLQPVINTSQTSESNLLSKAINTNQTSESNVLSKILAHKNNDQNDQVLIDLINNLDPAQVANIITLVEELRTESQTELDRITLASTNADTAFSDAENAHNAASMNKINGEAASKLELDNGVAALQAAHNATVKALQEEVDNALSVKESAFLAKQEANAVLGQEYQRLDHEIASLSHVILLLQNMDTTKLRSCRDVSGGSGLYSIDPDGSGPLDPVEVYCEMSIDGGGWTVIAYIRKQDQWDSALVDAHGVVGDVNGGFTFGGTILSNPNLSGNLYNQKLLVFLSLQENGVDLGTQWMVNSRNDPLPFSSIKERTGWSYYDSFGYTAEDAGNVCSHGCDNYKTFGMFRAPYYSGTEGGNRGCRDGNNICWMSRGMTCNVGKNRCALLTGSGEGAIYAVRNSL